MRLDGFETTDIDLRTAFESLENQAGDAVFFESHPSDVIGTLDAVEQMKKTLEEIGESYGVTKECIRQIEKRALNKIAQDEYYKNCLISYIK